MYKVLITGSTGKLGSYLTNSLSKKFKVYHNGKKKRLVDLTKINKLEKYLIKLRPNFIINCAAITNIEMCEKKRNETNRVNFGIVKNLIEIKKKFNSNYKIIQISTDQMYDAKNYKINTESKKPIINNNYTRQKIKAEKILLKDEHIILRTNFFGFTNNKKNPSFTDWLYQKAQKKIFIHLFDDVKFNPVRLNTIAKAIAAMIINNNIKGIFNVGSRNGLTKKKFALKFLKKFKNIRYKSAEVNKILKTKRSKNMIMNVKKFEKYFKFKLPRIEQEIKKEVNFYEKNYNQ